MNTQTPDQEWKKQKRIIKRISNGLQTNLSKRSNQIWITQHTLDTIEERKKVKKKRLTTQPTREKYKTLCKKMQRQCIDRTKITI